MDSQPSSPIPIERIEAEALDGILFERNEDPRFEDVDDNELPI